MGHKRQKYHNSKKNIFVFTSTLVAVLCIGMIGLGITYMVKEKNRVSVYEFFSLPTNERDKFAQTALEEELDKNQSIYQEALEKGQRVKMVPCVDEDKVTLLFAGDVLLDDNYAMMSNFVSRGSNMEDTFGNGLLYEMQQADIFMLNNEFTFTDRGTPTPGKLYTFRSKTANVSFLKEMGADIVSLANNHSYDYGEVSLLDTLDTLKNADIPYAGAGENLAEAMEPYYLIANGMKLAFVAGTQLEKYDNAETKGATETAAGTLRCVNPENLLQSIRIAEENADFTILFIHWGTETQETIDWMQEEQVSMYTEAGVDLIIGAHPHVLQKIDYVDGVPVVYSLGNFWFNSKTRDTGMIKVTLKDKEIKELAFLPCLQSDCRTNLLSGDEKGRVLQYMRSLSNGINIDSEGIITKK